MELVAATTTRYPRGAEDIRSGLALLTLERLREEGIRVVVVDEDSPPGFSRSMTERGAEVLSQVHPGMGAGRRQAISIAVGRTGPEGYVFWMEPEKVDLVRSIHELLAFAIRDDIDLVIPGRETLESYPVRQRTSEQLGNDFFFDLTGRELDVYFGPRLMRATAAQLFLKYNPRGLPDLWDCIFNPVLTAMHRGLKVQGYPVAYQHPSEQTEADSSLDATIKRFSQLDSLSKAMRKHADRIGFTRRQN